MWYNSIEKTLNTGDRILRKNSLDFLIKKQKEKTKDKDFVKLFNNRELAEYAIHQKDILFFLIIHCNYEGQAVFKNNVPITKKHLQKLFKKSKWSINRWFIKYKNFVFVKDKKICMHQKIVKKG